MFLILLITATAIIPQAHSLKCEESFCESQHKTCGNVTKEIQCEAGETHCGAVRLTTTVHEDNNTLYETVKKSCLKGDMCSSTSYTNGIAKHSYTAMCCVTDMCNAELAPPPPNPKPEPNGIKCPVCEGSPNCTATLNCTGDETFCITKTDRTGEVFLKGCATESFCVNSLHMQEFENSIVTCCEGDLCSSGSSSITACILLLTTMVISLCLL